MTTATASQTLENQFHELNVALSTISMANGDATREYMERRDSMSETDRREIAHALYSYHLAMYDAADELEAGYMAHDFSQTIIAIEAAQAKGDAFRATYENIIA